MTRSLIYLAISLISISAVAPAAPADSRLEKLPIESLVSEARTVLGRAKIDKTSEKQLEQIVLSLSSRPESSATRALLEELATRPPQILIPHEEGGAMIPFVDVGATARFALRNWARRTARQDALRAIRSADPDFLQNYFSASKEQQTGMLDAIDDANATDLLLYRDELANRLTEAGGDKFAAAVAVALADTTLFQRVIVAGSAPVALDTIDDLDQTIGGDAALMLMQSALKRPDIASATLFAIGRLTPSVPAAKSMLWELLADPTLGGSAAAVLARTADRDTIDRLSNLLYDSDQFLTQQRALLALRLSGDPRGLEIATDWQADQTGVDH